MTHILRSSNARWGSLAAAALATVALVSQSAEANQPLAGSDPALSAAVAQAQAGANVLATISKEAQEQHLGSAAQLKAAGAARIAKLALPPGHELTVNWDAGAEQGGDSAFGAANVAELNAACHWLGYVAARGPSPAAAKAIAAVSSWPAIRSSDAFAARFAELERQIAAGDLSGVQQDVAANCPEAKR